MDPLQAGDPRSVGRYVLEARLGGGGMGLVFLGRSPGGRPVAVKLVRPEYGSDPRFRRRFAAEVEAARRVGGFFTAQVVDADPEAERPWLVTAYVPGPSLQAAVDGHGPLPVRAVRVLGAGLAEGLAAIHACGLVHRDLKPGNVILAGDGPRVIDFGIVRALEDTSGTALGVVAGTAAYMSPEQARGAEPIGPASDVFSLGCVLRFAATGAGPFGNGPVPAVLHRVTREDPDLSGVPAELRDLVAACLAKDPAARPGVEEVLRRCRPAASPGPPQAWLPPTLTAMITSLDAGSTTHDAAAARGRRKIRWILGAVSALVAAALVATVLVLALRDDGRDPAAAPPPASAPGRPASPVTGRIHDQQAGFSYARLDAPWTAAAGSWTQPGMFTSGQVAPVQAPRNGASFNATSLGGVPRAEEIDGYKGPQDLAAVAAKVKARVLRELFTVQHTRTTLGSGPVPVEGGGRAWLEKIRLDFPQATANGWQVTADTLAVLLIDQDGRDGGRPGLLLVSVPDAFTTQGDLEKLLSSVQVP